MKEFPPFPIFSISYHWLIDLLTKCPLRRTSPHHRPYVQLVPLHIATPNLNPSFGSDFPPLIARTKRVTRTIGLRITAQTSVDEPPSHPVPMKSSHHLRTLAHQDPRSPLPTHIASTAVISDLPHTLAIHSHRSSRSASLRVERVVERTGQTMRSPRLW